MVNTPGEREWVHKQLQKYGVRGQLSEYPLPHSGFIGGNINEYFFSREKEYKDNILIFSFEQLHAIFEKHDTSIPSKWQIELEWCKQHFEKGDWVFMVTDNPKMFCELATCVHGNPHAYDKMHIEDKGNFGYLQCEDTVARKLDKEMVRKAHSYLGKRYHFDNAGVEIQGIEFHLDGTITANGGVIVLYTPIIGWVSLDSKTSATVAFIDLGQPQLCSLKPEIEKLQAIKVPIREISDDEMVTVYPLTKGFDEKEYLAKPFNKPLVL